MVLKAKFCINRKKTQIQFLSNALHREINALARCIANEDKIIWFPMNGYKSKAV